MDADDRFEGFVFDDDFVRGASRAEPSAEERLEAARQATVARAVRGPSVAVPRRRRRAPWGILVLLVVLGMVAYTVVRVTTGRVGSTAVGFHQGADVFVIDGKITRYPTPPSDVSDTPLRSAPAVTTTGAHAFVSTVGGEPVRWDPCRPITLVVGGGASVPGATELLADATGIVSQATGLVFEVEGTTDEQAADTRSPVQDRYGDRWAPVLVSWTDPETLPGLAGDVAGLGGGQQIEAPDTGVSVYVTGGVYLDAPTFREILGRSGGREVALGIVVHELGHLVGLDHVDDPTELMYGGANDVTTLGPGDRQGLALLGGGPCVPSL
ncbi:MAG: hypothetical protein KF906_10190 [Actinobacteria bacterium]|nr:hypothetical protein [Actinomycetota bacterium]